MATTYAELKLEIQNWVDNDNPNFVASIPGFISDAESHLSRILRALEQQCRTSTPAVPDSVADETRGIYVLPDDWSEMDTVEMKVDDAGVHSLLIQYYRRIPPLTDIDATNWLLAKHPDIYRLASLVAADAFLKNDPRSSTWKARSDEAIEELVSDDESAKFSGGPIASRAPAYRPWRGYSSIGAGRLEFLPNYDFFDLVEAVPQGTYRVGPGYFTVVGGKLHIWPRPTTDPTGPEGWSSCA